MPIAPRRPPQVAHKIFRGSRAVAHGWLSRSELRSSAWQRLFHDVYADARMERTHKLLCRAAQTLLLPEDAMIAGRSAAHLFGVPYVGGDEPVEVLTPRRFGPFKGLKIHVGARGHPDPHASAFGADPRSGAVPAATRQSRSRGNDHGRSADVTSIRRRHR